MTAKYKDDPRDTLPRKTDDPDRKSGSINDPAIDKRRPADEDGLSDYDANYPDGAVPSSGSARRRKRRGSPPAGHPQDERQAGGDTPSSSPAAQK